MISYETSNTISHGSGDKVNDEVNNKVNNKVNSKLNTLLACFLLVTTLVPMAGCFDSSPESDEDTIVLYGFSVKGEVFDNDIIPAFKDYWKEKTGEKIRFKTTYAGSGKITNQVITGAPAEVMILSTEWDALQLKKEGLVTTDWNTFPHNGTVSKSPWVVMTRPGNPKGISDFPDLAADGVEIVHADPLTSGGARWSIFSIYGSELKKTERDQGAANGTVAKNLLEGIAGNVISWQSSARKALSQFSLGYGDAFITYENEALLTKSQGEDYEIVYPECTIYSEHKAVIVDDNVNDKEREVIEEFMNFLYTAQAQRCMANHGFRSVNDSINSEHEEFPAIRMPFTVEYLGGWEKAHAEIIDGVFKEVKD